VLRDEAVGCRSPLQLLTAKRIAHQLQRLRSLDTIRRSLKMKRCQLHAIVRRRAANGADLFLEPTIGAWALPPVIVAGEQAAGAMIGLSAEAGTTPLGCPTGRRE
jgi:hypothetical protein